MKALYYIFGLALLTLASCSSGLYVGTEYDDLYYRSSDQPLTRVQTRVSQPVTEGNLQSGAYYDNKYASDTLVSKEYADAVDYNNAGGYNDNYNNNYYDNYSYAGRLNRFYGNYFSPYWRDPFYSSWYPSFGLNYGFGGFPYSYGYNNPYYYDPFYSDYYSPYSYGGLFGMNYYSPFYSSWYSPYSYGGYNSYAYGGYNSYSFNEKNGVKYGRREEPRALSTRLNGGGSAQADASLRRSSDIATGSGTSSAVRSSARTQPASMDSRRSDNSVVRSQQSVTGTDRRLTQDPARSGNVTGAQSRREVTTRPEYNSVNRSYTPSYSSPRMSTRPSYNNTRVNSNENFNNSRVNSNVNTNRGNTIQRDYQNSSNSGRSSSSYSAPARSGSSYSNSGSYSVPSRSGSYSSGSNNSGSRSSYSGGSSSGSVSRSSSYSSGSSGGSSSSGGGSSSGGNSSSGGGSSSGGHRR